MSENKFMGIFEDMWRSLFYKGEVVNKSEEVLVEKIKISENDECECFSRDDIKRQDAIKIDVLDAFDSFIKNNNFNLIDSQSYEKFDECNYIYFVSTSTMIKNCIELKIRDKAKYISFVFPMTGSFQKSACIACNTCLGWTLSSKATGLIKIESPDDYFTSLINQAIKEAEKKIDDEELAKRICNIE